MTFLASIVSGLFGLPPGLGHVPGRQLVDLRPPLGISCLSFACSLRVLARGQGADKKSAASRKVKELSLA